MNKFGSGKLWKIEEVEGYIFTTCTACMSIYAEFLSWVNAHTERFAFYPMDADSIIVLSCQVTDLAVLNDLRALESLMALVPGKTFYIGGCLAKRFDIPLPPGVRRLDNAYSDYTPINRKLLVDWRPPFWVPNFDKQKKDGHLFREMYPLRIGVGCMGTCAYCTIRVTRGEYREIPPNIDEFLNHDNIVLIADAPRVQQVITWCDLAKTFNKPISWRNVEPTVAMKTWSHIKSLAFKGLLKHFHSPIQSPDPNVLKDMGRDVGSTLALLDNIKALRSLNVFTATNVIIDYKDFPNTPVTNLFDYVSWNPYWDGVWDRTVAEKRYKEYIDGISL